MRFERLNHAARPMRTYQDWSALRELLQAHLWSPDLITSAQVYDPIQVAAG
jgi:hypothetical protein